MENLNAYLASRSYVTGYKPTADDAALFESLGGAKGDAKTSVNVYRWSKHINDFAPEERKAWPKGDGLEAVQSRISAAKSSAPAKGSPKKEASPKKVASPKKEAASASAAAPKPTEDEIDFGDEDDPFADDNDDAEAAEALKEKMRKHKEDLASGKVKPTQRSLIVLEVKPFDEETDLQALALQIKQLTHPGIQNWGQEHKFVDVAYGIQKLVLSAVVFDDLVGVDELSEMIEEGNEDKIQSIDVAAMSKV